MRYGDLGIAVLLREGGVVLRESGRPRLPSAPMALWGVGCTSHFNVQGWVGSFPPVHCGQMLVVRRVLAVARCQQPRTSTQPRAQPMHSRLPATVRPRPLPLQHCAGAVPEAARHWRPGPRVRDWAAVQKWCAAVAGGRFCSVCFTFAGVAYVLHCCCVECCRVLC